MSLGELLLLMELESCRQPDDRVQLFSRRCFELLRQIYDDGSRCYREAYSDALKKIFTDSFGEANNPPPDPAALGVAVSLFADEVFLQMKDWSRLSEALDVLSVCFQVLMCIHEPRLEVHWCIGQVRLHILLAVAQKFRDGCMVCAKATLSLAQDGERLRTELKYRRLLMAIERMRPPPLQDNPA